MKKQSLSVCATLCILSASLLTQRAWAVPDPAQAARERGETVAEREARMEWWRDARFGMFIHWGLYSVPAGVYQGKRIDWIGEWIMNTAGIPVEEYASYAERFNPTNFDADAIARLAKDAGMKYVVITAKHHDGFAMFDSDVSDYNIVDATPFKRDVIRELAEACRAQGLRFGVYYSQAQDWHHKGGMVYSTNDRNPPQWDPEQNGSYEDYLRDISVPQVRELLTKYGDLAVLWWDTQGDTTREQAKPLHDLLELQPQIITNDRLGGGYDGDTSTPEQRIPANGIPGRDWETCMTMNDTWGYKSWDHDYKPSETLIRNLVDIASKGGNYLLNIGPDATGAVPPQQIERLHDVGDWLDTNGEAIYGTTAAPFKRIPSWGRVTRKGSVLYLHVFDRPADGLISLPLENKVVASWLVGSEGTEGTVSQDSGGVHIEVPMIKRSKPGPFVMAIRVEGEPRALPIPPVKARADGVMHLGANAAEIRGYNAQLEGSGDAQNIGYWTDASDTVHWRADFAEPGTYRVVLNYACPSDTAGASFEVTVGGASVAGTTRSTGGWGDYKSHEIGTIRVQNAGVQEVSISPNRMGWAFMNLRSLDLVPVAD